MGTEEQPRGKGARSHKDTMHNNKQATPRRDRTSSKRKSTPCEMLCAVSPAKNTLSARQPTARSSRPTSACVRSCTSSTYTPAGSVGHGGGGGEVVVSDMAAVVSDMAVVVSDMALCCVVLSWCWSWCGLKWHKVLTVEAGRRGDQR